MEEGMKVYRMGKMVSSDFVIWKGSGGEKSGS